MNQKAEIEGMLLPGKVEQRWPAARHWKLGESHSHGSSLTALRRSRPRQYLGLQLQLSGLGDWKFLLWEPLGWWYFVVLCYYNPSKGTQNFQKVLFVL